MDSYGGTIAVQGENPCIAFQINSKNWYLLRLYDDGELFYQYIGSAQSLEIFLTDVGYGSYGYNGGEITYKITELKDFSEPDVTYEVNEKLSGISGSVLVDHAPLTERDVDHKQARYYKGDLHAHTNLTDGSLTPEELVRHAESLGLDFFFITDHNFFHHHWPKSDVLVLPGIEFTGNTGHWNALNIKRPIDMYGDSYHIETIEGTHQLMKDLKQEGTLVSINHPFLTVWSWLHDALDMDLIDSIEIWNDPSYIDNPKATEDALKFWHQSLLAGYHITAVGGTDFHHLIDIKDNNRENALNDPTTHVYSEGFNKQKLLDNICAGHVFVTRFIDVASMNVIIDGEVKLFGETYELSHDNQVKFTIEGQPVDGELHVITATNKLIVALEDNKAEFEIQLQEADFVRFEIRQTDELIAFTNPVYHNQIVKKSMTFGELKGLM